MMKKQWFIFILTILVLFIGNQLIVGFLNTPQSVDTQSLVNNTQIKPQKLFNKTWREIDDGFYDSSLNYQDWSYWKKHYRNKIKTDADAKVAIDTMVASLDDDYSRYLPKKDYAEQNCSIESKISGIGVNIMNSSGRILVYSVLDNTPAEKAGIKANDIILQVGNKKVSGMNIANVATLVRGEEGTSVKLIIFRNHHKLVKNVERKSIKIESVKCSVKNNIGYIKISSFIGTSTATEFVTALQKTNRSKGLIIDLRGNTGGLLANAVFIANIFIDDGTIVSILSRDGKVENIKSQLSSLRINKPIVVLVDGASASASEILSGALKDHHKAVLVGTRTFGKGMVQRIIPLPNATGLNLTIAKYLTPNGYDINKKGIAPDYIVNYSAKDFIHHKDPQRNKAESILTNMINNK